MKKGRLLNSEVLRVLARMGHTDQVTVADAGLPIADHVERIDLALMKGVPSFIETVKLLKDEMVIERVVIASEIEAMNPSVHQAIVEIFEGIEMVYVTHEAFKELTHHSKAVVRTGECTPYANIILQSGVDFEGDAHG